MEEDKIFYRITAVLVRKFILDLKDEFLIKHGNNPNFSDYVFELNSVRRGDVEEDIFIVAIQLKVFYDEKNH